MKVTLASFMIWLESKHPEDYRDNIDLFSDFLDEVEKDMQKEMVNHPSHYQTPNGVECIDAIQAALSPEEFAGFLKGNALKYIWRAGKKGDPIQDFKKSAWYIDKLI